MLKICGIDPNGQLSSSDFISMCEKVETITLEEQMKGMFQAYDEDNSGFLSKTEVRQIMEDLGEKVDQDKLDTFMALVDADGDEQISLEELEKLLWNTKFLITYPSFDMKS